MRPTPLLVVALVLLAGCGAPFAVSDGSSPGATPGGTDAEPTPVVHEERPDPDTDRLGWEDGYWHDDPVAVDPADGLNATERDAVVSRAMARVEVIRDREFQRTVGVTVLGRSNFSASGNETESAAFRTFDNAKFEALYLIGKDENSIETQDEARNRTVAGFYSSARESIVIVSDSESPQLDGERTLAHELVHALQDQQFNLSAAVPETRDAYNGRNGLIEGDARYVEQRYVDRCGETWACLLRESEGQNDSGSGDGPSINLGVYVLSYFPYSDGPGFVSHLRDNGNWSRVDEAFSDPPSTSAVVIAPEKYGSFEPRDVQLQDRTRNGWERIRPEERADYAELGQSALTAMFAYTLYDEYNTSAVVRPTEFLNTGPDGVNRSDPFEYDLAPARGWDGDRMHVYERGNESAYVWRLAWESRAGAERFAGRYRTLLSHWGGEQVDDGVWVIGGDSPFADAVALEVSGDTVTIVNAPERGALSDVYRGAG